MAIQATPKPIGHHHGKKSNSARAGNRWGPRTLRRHLEAAHGTHSLGSLEEMRQQHKKIHNEAPHTHDAKIGPPWTLDGLVGHLNKRHAKEFHAIVERDGLMVSELYLDAARLIHDEVHGGTQLKPETKAPMSKGGSAEPPHYRDGRLTYSAEDRTDEEAEVVPWTPPELREEAFREQALEIKVDPQRRVDWRFRDALIAAGIVFAMGFWIGYALARNLWP